MTPAIKRRVQIILVLLLIAAAIRVAIIFRERHSAPQQAKTAAPPLEADYYVNPKKLHDYDAASLRKDLVGSAVWVKEGYRYTYYPYDPARRRANLASEAGTLGPIEKLEITGVVTQPTPGNPGQQQILATFRKDGREYAVPVGTTHAGQQSIYADEIFFYEDPHELYKHWTPEVWDAIAHHEVRPGMNELQASFAVGMGMPEAPSSSAEKTVHYPNGGHSLIVVYRNGRATQVTQG